MGIGIDAYYKFDVQEGARGYNLGLFCYLYFCFYLGKQLSRRILKIKSWVIKVLGYACLCAIVIIIFDVNGPTNEGLLDSIDTVIVFTAFFAAILMTFYFLYIVFFKSFRKFLAKFPRLLFNGVIFWVVISTVAWFFLNRNEVTKPVEQAKAPPTPQLMVQAWQLNSRYKVNKIVKMMKVDLDKNGKEELAAITSYDKLAEEVFYYAGFYRFNGATEKWDEFYEEELNILNYGIVKDKIEESEKVEYIQKIVDLWSNEFTTLENIGDVTGDGCPEIVFSSLLQGKSLENYIIVAQAGDSSPFYKVFWDQRAMAEMVAEDGLLIEKFSDEEKDYKNILEWHKVNLRFKLIESQKSPGEKSEEKESPKINPIWEEFSV